VALEGLQRPQTQEEENEFVQKFLNGLEKVFSDANRGVLQPFQLSFDYCAKCDTCSEACHVYKASGGEEVFRQIFRSDALLKIYRN
jgi:ferredoxin